MTSPIPVAPKGATAALARLAAPVGLALLCLGALGCASGGAAPADARTIGRGAPDAAPLDADARWALLPATGADARAGRSVASLVETGLRARGVADIEHLDGDGDGALERAGHAGHRYALGTEIERWGYAGRLGRAPRVDLALEVIDLVDGRVAWSGRVERSGLAGTALAELGGRAVAEAVEGLALRSGAGPTRVDGPAGALGARRAVPAAATHGSGPEPRSGPATSPIDRPVRAMRSIALHYGDDLPVAELAMFDRVVVEPDHTDAAELAALGRHGAAAYAYLSVGEVGPHRAHGREVEDGWVLGENAAWGSRVMDATEPGWRALLGRRVDELVDAGYAGLFLDTLDSHRLHATTPEARAAQERALAEFLEAVRARHPALALIANRGFEILPRVAPLLEAVAAESLHAGWSPARGAYADVPPADRAWLTDRLREVVDVHGLEAIAIDYLPPARREEAREVARRIAADGFTPWVTTPELDHLGVGAIEVLPREVLMLFDGRVNGAQEWSEVHKLVATPLEYLGYVPRYHDVALEGLPRAPLAGRVAGIVAWGGEPWPESGTGAWLADRVEEGVRVALFGAAGGPIDARLAELLGVRPGTGLDVSTASVSVADDLIGFEREAARRLDAFGFDVRSVSAENEVHLAYEDARGRRADVVLTGPRGGIAAHPGAASTDLDGVYRWSVDPFEFLSRALDLVPIPAPDVTTENGRRLWLAHIDGDALPSWAEVPGGRLGAEEIEARILARWPWPHTISIVEAEMVARSDSAARRARMFSVARRLFRLPFVEIASHSYSHPFDWQLLADDPHATGESLPVPDYAYDPEREIGGSVDFIESMLAPPGKPVTTFLWTGDALPDADALAAVEARDLVNLNGGLTRIVRERPALALVDPMARTVGEHLQVYAPVTNENIYTNEWLGPFDGFRRVIETFELTDRPRRLKPINVYYHFYAGTKAASLRSLEEVYAWSTAQEVHPVHVSEYAPKVAGFRRARVARALDGRWSVAGLGEVRSLRLLGEGWRAELADDDGLVGQRTLHDGTYLHTDGADRVSFDARRRAPGADGAQADAPRVAPAPHLVSANGRVVRWEDTGAGLSLRIAGHVPVELELGGALGGCALVTGGEAAVRVAAEPTARDTFAFRFDDDDTGDAHLDCPA